MALKMNINKFLADTACFDLQFRRDVRHKRTGSPVYYSWKAQFIVTGSLDREDLLREIQELIGCGKLHYITAKQLRYSVQSIDDIHDKVIPFLRGYPLRSTNARVKDFELWAKAVEIIHQNKGISLSQWPKESFGQLINIQKAIQKYKAKRVQNSKWLPVAEAVLEHLK
jgi:hypothetical protein